VPRAKVEMPGFINLANLKPKAPKGEQWIHEIKYDGYRVQVHVNAGRKKVYTRMQTPPGSAIPLTAGLY
jgi:bifunctional non-homologous end joining protein LigD